MIRKSDFALLAGIVVLHGCSSSGSAGTAGAAANGATANGNTIMTSSASGKMLAVRLPSTVSVTTNSITKTPEHNATITSAVASDRTAPTGVVIAGSAEEDTSVPATAGAARPALVTASVTGTMQNGASFIGLNKAKGNVYFENGNFGDPQVEDAGAAISSVGVYNKFSGGTFQKQIVLTEATTIRYRDGNAGDTASNYGVGYVGNPTQSMPNAGTATYEAFLEQGTSAYTKADGSVEQFGFDQDATVALTADFAAGKVTGGVSGTKLVSYGATQTVLNPNVTGLKVDATITGSEYAGTAALVDAAGQTVGTLASGNAIGGFFGADAKETAAAVALEGTAPLGGASSAYVYQAVIGGVKQ